MAKQRKTRKEKLQRDRRLTTPSEIASPSQTESQVFTFSSSQVSASKPQATPAEYAYLTRDLLKTTILTISIFVVEILLALVIKI